ncbi:hypothetical protein PG985_016360 [Apiospora marii]|uniref:uncharacterized protein n=1 Tax=Apiospora marii TaxID=335849 RepID=UPI00312CC459
MAVSHILITDKQVRTVELETPEAFVYFVLSTRHHWVAVRIHVSPLGLPQLPDEEIKLCKSWGYSCCSKAPKAAEVIRRFYNAQCEPGKWLDGGYIREDHTVKPNVSCQESKSSLPAEYGESANVDAAASEQGATDSTSIARQRADHGAVQAESQSRHDRVVDDLRDESPASFAVQKFKTGRSQFSQCKNYAGPELAIPSRLAGGVRSVEEAIRAIAEMRNKQRDWAKIEDWIWEHLLRCLRVLQYHEQGNGNLLSAVGHRPEKSAYWINSLVEAVAKRIGPWGLLVNCAYSVVNFRWSAAGHFKDDGHEITKTVCEGILSDDIHVPENLYLFNPATSLYCLLGRDYKELCRELGLESLSACDPNAGIGPLNLIPLGQLSRPNVRLPLVWKDEERCWVIVRQEDTHTNMASSSKKRKRNGNKASTTTRAPTSASLPAPGRPLLPPLIPQRENMEGIPRDVLFPACTSPSIQWDAGRVDLEDIQSDVDCRGNVEDIMPTGLYGTGVAEEDTAQVTNDHSTGWDNTTSFLDVLITQDLDDELFIDTWDFLNS